MKTTSVGGVFLVAVVAGLVWPGPALAAGQLKVDPGMLREGADYLDNEVLAWERLRAERRVILEQDDSSPIVTKDGTRTIYAVTYSGKLLTSADGGRTFLAPAAITVEGNNVTGVQAMGVLKSGTVLIVYGSGGKLFAASSTDGGKGWRLLSELKEKGYTGIEAGQGIHLVQLDNGTVLLPVVRWKGNNREKAEGFIYGSKDEGKTWAKIGSLGERCANANLLRLRSGELLGAITYKGSRQEGDPAPEIQREELFNNVVIAHSRDGAKTWSDYQCVTRYREGPANLVELADGTVVLTYGQQNFPYGARAIISKDTGRTWSEKIYILGFSSVWAEWYAGAMFATGPAWHANSVALGDGVILTLYTRGALELTEKSAMTDWYKKNRTLGERGKAVLAVRWTLEGMNKPALSFPGVIAKPNAQGYLDNARCLIKPEHMNEGGDYFYKDEILVYQRVPAEHYTVGPGGGPIVSLDPEGNPVVGEVSGRIYRSANNGRSWEQISTIPHSNYIQSFGALRDGTLLAADSSGSEPLKTSVIRSEDRGQTWAAPIRIDPTPFDNMGGGNCMRITQTPDGTALMTTGNLYLTPINAPGLDLPWDGIYRSRDGGKTWGDFSYICHPCCETNVLRLKSGRLLAATRFQGSRMTDDFILMDEVDSYRNTFIKNVSLIFSDDAGYTWSKPWTVTRYFECPGDLVEMNDGTLVLSYQQKNAPGGPRGMVSFDEGKTWDARVYMLGWWPKAGGHTSSVLLSDGRVLTIGVGNGQLQATIWKPLPAKH